MNAPGVAALELEAYRRVLDHCESCRDCNRRISCPVGHQLRQALKVARRECSVTGR